MLLKAHRDACMKLFKMKENNYYVTGPYYVSPFKSFQREVTFKFTQNNNKQNGENFK
jgi:hypothetical protein